MKLFVDIENQTPAETAERIAAFVSWNNPFSTPIISFSKKRDIKMTDSQVTKFHLANCANFRYNVIVSRL